MDSHQIGLVVEESYKALRSLCGHVFYQLRMDRLPSLHEEARCAPDEG